MTFLPQPSWRENLRVWLSKLPFIGRFWRINVEFTKFTMPLLDITPNPDLNLREIIASQSMKADVEEKP